MSGRDLTFALERRLVNAWPAFEVELAEGWLLRFAEGYSKRANAATPIVAGARLDPDLVEAIAASYAARGLPVCFRLTGIEDEEAEALLAACGFVEHDPSLGLAAALRAGPSLDPSIVLASTPSAAWVIAAASAYGGDKADHDTLARILTRIRQPAAFATLSLDGEDAAWGFAVVERGYVGIYDIVVAPELRGLGLGRRLVSGLMTWGRSSGAATAYLQMRASNDVAFALYRSLGFEIAYRYSHRLLGEEARAATTAPATVRRQARARAQDGGA
jgi:ribosomal protein S18 acetylase RimI-like enzyme